MQFQKHILIRFELFIRGYTHLSIIMKYELHHIEGHNIGLVHIEQNYSSHRTELLHTVPCLVYYCCVGDDDIRLLVTGRVGKQNPGPEIHVTEQRSVTSFTCPSSKMTCPRKEDKLYFEI